MVDIAFIHPGAAREIYGVLADEFAAVEPPTWTRMIAGWLRERGYSIRIVDQGAENLSPEEAVSRVGDCRLVAIVVTGQQPSASTQQMVGARAVAQAANCAGHTVIMLGNHPSALPERTLREEPVDYVCDGEGPLTLKAMLDGDARADIPGLVWWDHGEVRRNKLAPLISIDDLGGDVWDLLPMDRTRSHSWQRFDDLSRRQPYASIYSTLGCPHSCSFCCINAFQHSNRYRRRDPIKVVDQIELLNKEYGVETLKIADELFGVSENHYVAVCEEMVKRGLGDRVATWAYFRPDGVKENHLDLLRRSGITWLALGIESGSKEVRDGADKALKSDDIIGPVRAIQKAGISVIGNFIYGLESDSMETMQETLDLSMELNCEFMNAYVCVPYPGSPLYDEKLASGARMPPTWLAYSQHSYETHPLDTEYVRAEDVLRFRDEAFQRYFTNPAYLSMIRAKFGDQTVAHIEAMTKKTIRRKLLETA